MRLAELNLSDFKYIAKKKFGYPDDIIDFLEKNDYRISGVGDFSQVWIHPTSNIAIKISTGNDKCWIKYAGFVKKNPNIHFLKIGKISKLKGFYIAFIEKLKRNPGRASSSNMSDWATVFIDRNGFEDFSSTSYYNNARVKKRIIKFEQDNPELIKAMRLINQKLVKSPCSFDLFGPQNFMQRNDGTIVIIDPLYFEVD